MDIPIEEAFTYNYWMIVLRLLKLGLPWDYIETLSEPQLFTVLAIEAAVEEKQQEDQDAEMKSSMAGVSSSFGGF